MSDAFGDKVKALEAVAAKATLSQEEPICVRLDGKAFHSFTRGLARPYDARFSDAMIQTMKFLIEKTDARIGYTQSDEITLVYFKTAPHQEGYFGGRVQKLTSVLASMATAKFNAEVMKHIPEKSDDFAFFDCRVWNVPTLKDVEDVLVWRQEDAIKNAVSMAAYAHFSHKAVLKKNSKEKIEMLAEVGMKWDDYPDFFKSGTFAMRRHQRVELPKELKGLRGNEEKDSYLRSEIVHFSLPRLKGTNLVQERLFDCVMITHQEAVQERNQRRGKALSAA
jgi:tRNA(His) 5'-end guanylyltransferase